MDKNGSLVPKKPSLLASLYPRKDTTKRSRVLVWASARISNVPLCECKFDNTNIKKLVWV